MNVFLAADDRRVFLRMLQETSDLHSLRHYSYSLMTNHVHLIFDKTLLFDVKSIRNEKDTVKKKNRAESEGGQRTF